MAKLRSLEEEFKLMGHVLDENYMKAQERLAIGENYGEDDEEGEEEKTEMSPGSPDDVAAEMPKKSTPPPAIGSTPMKNEDDDDEDKKDDDGEDDGEDEKPADKSDGEKPWDKEKSSEKKEKKAKKGDDGKFAAKVDQKPSAGPEAATPKADMLPMGKRAAGESTDKLEVLMSELHKLTESAGAFDSDKKRLTRIFSNIAVVADVLSQRIDESDAAGKELGASLDKLAEDALLVAEGVTYGKIALDAARSAVKGYVKDLTSAIGPIAPALDEELEPKAPAPARLLAKK